MWGSLKPWGSLRPWGSLGGGGGPAAPQPATLRQAVYRLLSTSPALAATVGGRIWPGALPFAPEYPAVAFMVASSSEERNYRGAAWASTRVQVNAWAETQAAAALAARACRSRLVDFSGWVGAVCIEDCELVNELDLPERPGAAQDPCMFRVVLDLRIVHRVT